MEPAVAAAAAAAAPAEPAASPPAAELVCIGDLHGHIDKTEALWGALTERLGPERLASATVVFLGDYCDRGPYTRDVIEWLLTLEASRKPGRTKFLAGNHDFGFGSFLRCMDVPEGFDLDATKPPQYDSGFWAEPLAGGMHYQGRRWGGDAGKDPYSARATFSSYGVVYEAHSSACREKLARTVPPHHQAFLNRLLWVYDAPVAFSPGRVVCVHAGLVAEGPLDPQLAGLAARDLAAEALQQTTYGRFEALSGRQEVEHMHPELAGQAMLVSGHHGFSRQEGDRLIMDTSGGRAGAEWPIEAIVLPSQEVISSNGQPARAMPRRPAKRSMGAMGEDFRPMPTAELATAARAGASARVEPLRSQLLSKFANATESANGSDDREQNDQWVD